MKKIKIVLSSLFLLTLVFQSCEDQHEVSAPNFNVTPITMSAITGEPVEFSVENAPNFLMFYSGEFGHEYQYRDRTRAEGTVYMSFNNAQKWGLGVNATGTLSILASTDYDGTGTTEAIGLATWTDISDRFNISEDYTFDWTFSGDADITDLDNGEIIYFAIRRYAEEHHGTGNRQPEWRISEFNIRNDINDSGNFLEVISAATTGSSGFTGTSVDGEVVDWNGHQWYWDTGFNVWRIRSENPRHRNDDYLITDGVNLSAVLPDEGVVLKTYSTPLESFEYTYSQPGTYTVTMVGNNTTVYGSEEKIQEFEITVTDLSKK